MLRITTAALLTLTMPLAIVSTEAGDGLTATQNERRPVVTDGIIDESGRVVHMDAWWSPRPTLPQRGGQQGLTAAQLQSAALEVPRLMELLDLEPGDVVADVGAGFGAWTAEFAGRLGPTGRVFATDLGEAQLAALRDSAASQPFNNVTVLEGAVDSTNLPAGCCGAILIRDAYHHLTQPREILESMLAALEPGGRLAVIDFPPRPGSQMSRGVPDNRGGHGVPPEIVIEEVTAAGMALVSDTRDWSPRSEPGSLFLLIFTRP